MEIWASVASLASACNSISRADHAAAAAGLPCASGDELVLLGFRVGNPSAIGGHQRANFSASLLPVGVTPTTSRRIATRSLRRKMARSPSRSGGRRHVFSPQEGAKTIPRGGVFFCAQATGVDQIIRPRGFSGFRSRVDRPSAGRLTASRAAWFLRASSLRLFFRPA